MAYFGYLYHADGMHFPPVRLKNPEAVSLFIQDNLEAPQLIITDTRDQQLLHLRDGVDLFNELDQIGISLNSILAQRREEVVLGASSSQEKAEWERLYDQIGLSPGEIRMRQHAKAACRAARTVEDVADLVRGTYFDAHFISSDGRIWYRFFNEDDFSITTMEKDSSGNWAEDDVRIHLSPAAKVKHLRSREDTHTFELID